MTKQIFTYCIITVLTSVIISCNVTYPLLGICDLDELNVVEGTGTLKFLDFEGGFYGIIGDDGEHYDPLNLGEEFRVDGLRVHFKVRIEEEMVSFHMWGIIVSIISIEEVEPVSSPFTQPLHLAIMFAIATFMLGITGHRTKKKKSNTRVVS